jgi:hypothetical protein
MEYFVLGSTLISLFAGFLFFVDKLYAFNIVAKYMLIIFTMIVIIGANVFIVCMIAYDIFVRRKKERKREKNKRKLREEIKNKERKKREYEKKHGLTSDTPTTKDDVGEFDFKIYKTPSESEEDGLSTMNEIFDDLISIQRLKKKIFIAKKKGKKYSIKIIKGANTISKKASGKRLSENLSKRISVFNIKEEEIAKLEETEEMKEKEKLEKRRSMFTKVKKVASPRDSRNDIELEELDSTTIRFHAE